VQTTRFQFALYAVIIAIGVVRIASTHHTFSETLDEPAHVAAGFEWLEGNHYALDPSHPPLSRALFALPAKLQGVPHSDEQDFVARGNEILYFQDHYEQNLARARWGNLLFFILGAVSVAMWGARAFGHTVGIIATALFSYLPPILGHSGLATTDMAACATVAFAIVMLDRFLDEPSRRRSVLLGVAIAIGLLSKFSFLVFFPLAAVIVIVTRKKWGRASSIGIAIVVAFLIVWAGYRFDFGTIASRHQRDGWVVTVASPRPLAHVAEWIRDRVPIPAPSFAFGLAMIKFHDSAGHESYLFGHVRNHGWWYYFPVVFFFKTPLPFLILAIIGIAMIIARERRVLAIALIPIAFMLAVLPTSINIGIRHILPIYPPLCVAAAFAAITLWRSVSMRAVVIALAAWMVINVERAHPDYLAWFNEAAGDHPEKIVVDSNLDWGQDVLRLSRTINRLHIGRVWILYNGNALLQNHKMYAEAIRPWTQEPGWYVLSETSLALNPDARRGAYKWLDGYAMRRVGKSMRLIHVPH
jgi:hypothetical protein